MKLTLVSTCLRKFLFIGLLLLSRNSFAQQAHTVTGHITDASGKSLAGVTISVKGKNTSTGTESNGSFSVTAGANDILVVTSVGYKTQEIKVNSRLTINIVLNQCFKFPLVVRPWAPSTSLNC